MPRYEFVKGKSSKFWEISLSGKSFTTRYGRIGAAGQATTKKHASEAEASRQYEKLIAEKVGKGYKPAGGETLAKAPPQSATPAKGARKSKLPRLPPSYSKHVKRHGTEELERKASREERRSRKLPGYPARLLLCDPTRLARFLKIFRKSLIPPEDLVKPHDHSHLVPFGDDTEQTWMCWDPAMQRPDGEMMICFIDGEQGDQRTDAGYDLERILSAYERAAPEDY